MKKSKKAISTFKISFSGLKEGAHKFDFEILHEFFDFFNYAEFSSSKLTVCLKLEKKTTLLEFNISIAGTLGLYCDVTNEPFELFINPEHDFVVKYGDSFDDVSENIVILPYGSHEIDLSKRIFETIVLSVPQKRIHPGVVDGSLKSEVFKFLENLHPLKKNIDNKKTDPRWDELKKLKK